jgi:phosphoserine phosphatase
MDRMMATKLWRLAEVIAAARRIHSSLALDNVLDTFLEIAVSESGAEGGAVYLGVAGEEPRLVAHKSFEMEGEARDHAQRIASASMGRRGPAVDPGYGDEGRLVSLALTDEAREAVGVLQVLMPDSKDLDEGSDHLLGELSHFASLSIRNAQVHADSLEKARLDREIGVAREIQLGTLPESMPQISGYEVAGISRPASETGGDSFDAFGAESGALVLLLADATGHGLGPALSVTQVRSMLRVSARLGAGLDEAFRHINDQLSEDLQPHRFVTAFLGFLDPESHRLRYHAAGQGPLFHVRHRSGATDRLNATFMPLGILPIQTMVAAQEVVLEPGDLFALITDGVFEATSPEGEEFGEDRVQEILQASEELSCSDAVTQILEAVDKFTGDLPQEDDITIVLVRRAQD